MVLKENELLMFKEEWSNIESNLKKRKIIEGGNNLYFVKVW